MNVVPNKVSGRVVKTVIGSWSCYLEGHVSTLGSADPVALGVGDLADPGVLQVVQVVDHLLRVVRGPEIPLRQFLLGDHGAAPLAGAVGQHLLVGQHRLVAGAPVDRAVLPVGQPLLAQLQEQPLGPAVVLRVGGVQPARPVEAQSVALHRRQLRLDVGVGVRRGVLVVADRRVLRGQAEGVPAHRVQDLVAAEPPVTRETRRAERTPRRAPCAGRRWGRETSSARSASPAGRTRRRRRRHGRGRCWSQTGSHFASTAWTSYDDAARPAAHSCSPRVLVGLLTCSAQT